LVAEKPVLKVNTSCCPARQIFIYERGAESWGDSIRLFVSD
jgi:hypothetical protein